MELSKKCSLEEHKEISAIKYCPQCRIYICNKCENYHSFLFRNHLEYNLNNDGEIFTGFCKEKNHPNKLEYFCKDHNQLCCANCLCKIGEKGDGQHKDCEVCIIQNMKEEKKIKLKENIKLLEELESNFTQSMEKLRIIFQKIDKDKEDLKLEIQNIFTKIRNALNNREDELLLQIDNIYNDKFFNENIIKEGEKLPKKIKFSLEKGKLIDKEWDNNNLSSNINDCINIEKNIKFINKINENINKCNLNNKIKIQFSPKNYELENFIQKINLFGKILRGHYSFKECPINIKEDRKYTVTGENKNILTKTGTDSRLIGAICENELDTSQEEYKWKIKFLKSKVNEIMVGVAPVDFDVHTSSYDTYGWYLYCRYSPPSLYSGPPYNYSAKEERKLCKIKDEVIVVMNMKKRSLKFIINNEDQGDSYNNIPIDKPLSPAVFLYYKDDSVEISEIE